MAKLQEISRERPTVSFKSYEHARAIQPTFKKEDRKSDGREWRPLPPTWSEHCLSIKLFAGISSYTSKANQRPPATTKSIRSLLKSTIAKPPMSFDKKLVRVGVSSTMRHHCPFDRMQFHVCFKS